MEYFSKEAEFCAKVMEFFSKLVEIFSKLLKNKKIRLLGATGFFFVMLFAV